MRQSNSLHSVKILLSGDYSVETHHKTARSIIDTFNQSSEDTKLVWDSYDKEEIGASVTLLIQGEHTPHKLKTAFIASLNDSKPLLGFQLQTHEEAQTDAAKEKEPILAVVA